jgi:hypothetical protein
VGDRFVMRLYNDVSENRRLEGWVSVILELTREISMIWRREHEIEGSLRKNSTMEYSYT